MRIGACRHLPAGYRAASWVYHLRCTLHTVGSPGLVSLRSAGLALRVCTLRRTTGFPSTLSAFAAGRASNSFPLVLLQHCQ